MSPGSTFMGRLKMFFAGIWLQGLFMWLQPASVVGNLRARCEEDLKEELCSAVQKCMEADVERELLDLMRQDLEVEISGALAFEEGMATEGRCGAR
mmetsp:Transcript_56330/g.105916  ORF Transcript_56330/g.105916 Transcript_56330/m.105916 type:complete len:96 (+) Transcript_56330:94-381(+)